MTDSGQITGSRYWRVRPDVLFRLLAEEAVVLDLKSRRYYGLDAVGTRLWQLFEQHGDCELVMAAMLEEYEVAEDELRRDLDEFLSRLAEVGLLLSATAEAEAEE